ncbi:hypothetical protein EST38_g31 [Candolleomyces aberdarensis]|uniref:NADP-dependent oxidoreductase domain-containing protein n=1 Tax=Candolleomyces aberdarensis TaxID=2316362 RepID=A0A4Q2E222_9AGAR|nr:hypothetical protein EST38_g31 [Candolleomyces aberdarensis]
MSAEHPYVERDNAAASGDDGLPSYDDLAAQNGPNSRFGRWKGWIEKRALERYTDITPEERRRRRERGWDLPEPEETSQSTIPPPILYTGTPAAPSGVDSLHIQTGNLSINESYSPRPLTPCELQLPFVSQAIPPSHLKINQFGSRFLPHATSPIRCILPLLADRLVLIGHDEGLSVLDMFPQDWTDSGDISVKQPNEALSYPIWKGEAVYQMTILEMEDTGEGTPQGVVLALVGPDPESPSSRDTDFRHLRMYNLSSLTSLARWAVSQKGARPLDLHRPSNWQAQHQSPPRRHRPQGSLARSIKSFIDPTPQQPEHPTSYQSLLTSPSGSGPSFAHGPPGNGRISPVRHDSSDSTWDIVDDLPLRNTSALFYATWYDRNRRSTGGQLLAIATKYSILLYESPKGERAYRFVKDFYAPLQPKNMCFFHQYVHEASRPPSESSRHRRTDSNGARGSTSSHSRAESNSGGIDYGVQLCLFVVFDKKAGWIRLADSAVGEFELRDDGGPPVTPLATRDSLTPSISSMTQRTRARLSFDIRESVAKWTLPVRCDLPVFDPYTRTMDHKSVMFLTKGRRTHILSNPLPTKIASVEPLHVIFWKNTPKQVSARVCRPTRESLTTPPRYSLSKLPFLQVISFGEAGIEVYETPLTFLYDGYRNANGNGKGKSRAVQPEFIRAEEDLGGDVGHLQSGGNWDQAEELYSSGLDRAESFAPSMSGSSIHAVDSDDVPAMLKQEAGQHMKLNTGAEIPTVGLGTWKSQPGQVEGAVEHALKFGYRHVDTATAYENESEVGKGIKASGVPRSEIFLTTKLKNTDHGDPAKALEYSLNALGTDYLDLWLMHWPAPMHPDETPDKTLDWLNTWKEMAKLYKAHPEKLRAIVVKRIADKHGVHPATILISLQANRPGVNVLTKSVTPARIESNYKLVDLTEEEIAELHEIDKTLHFQSPNAESGLETFFNNILKPGSSLNASFLAIVDGTFAALFVILAILAFLTSGNIHIFALMLIELGLWASVKWFVSELKKARAEGANGAEAEEKKDQ